MLLPEPSTPILAVSETQNCPSTIGCSAPLVTRAQLSLLLERPTCNTGLTLKRHKVDAKQKLHDLSILQYSKAIIWYFGSCRSLCINRIFRTKTELESPGEPPVRNSKVAAVSWSFDSTRVHAETPL